MYEVRLFVKKYVYSFALSILFFGVICKFAWWNDGIIERLCSYVAYPVIRFSSCVSGRIDAFFKERKTLFQLQQDVQFLQETVDALRVENIALSGASLYLRETQELRDFKKNYNLSAAVIGRVLVRYVSERAQYFLIDAGSNKQIQTDMVALVNNVLIGRVVEVYPWYSKVVLITDKSCKIAAVDAHTGAHGVLEGANQPHVFLKYIDHLSAIKKGDLILSSGQGLVFPQGFGLGTVADVGLQGLQYEISVKPLVDLTQVDYCLLISKEKMDSGQIVLQ